MESQRRGTTMQHPEDENISNVIKHIPQHRYNIPHIISTSLLLMLLRQASGNHDLCNLSRWLPACGYEHLYRDWTSIRDNKKPKRLKIRIFSFLLYSSDLCNIKKKTLEKWYWCSIAYNILTAGWKKNVPFSHLRDCNAGRTSLSIFSSVLGT